MGNDRSSHELLAHFDRPKVAELPDFEWSEDAEPSDSGFIVDGRRVDGKVAATSAPPANWRESWLVDDSPEDRRRSPESLHGATWVLKWAAAVAVIATSASVLAEFACRAAAEHALARAARAGAVEATLPRATYSSVVATVERRLADYPELLGHEQLTLLQNDSPVGHGLLLTDGDRFSIAISAPTSLMIPGWLRRLTIVNEDESIDARAESRLLGRKMAPRGAKGF